MKLSDLIQIVNLAYGSDGIVGRYYGHPSGHHGDTLAKFIAVELQETFMQGKNSEEQLDEAYRAIQQAVDDLTNVCDALTVARRAAHAQKHESKPR